MSQSTLFGGMEQGSMSQDLLIMQRLGWTPVVALRIWPALRAWTDALRASGIQVIDYAPPDFLKEWDRWRVRRVKKVLGLHPFARVMARVRPDGLICYSSSVADCLAHLWYASRYPVPCALSVHSTYAGHGFVHEARGIGLEPPPRWDGWHRRHLKQAFAALRGIRSVSDDTAAGFQRVFDGVLPAGLTPTTIYHGVDTSRFRPPTRDERLAARHALGLDDGVVALGTSARLTPQKGVVALLDTFIRLQQRHPQLRLVYAGEGYQRTELSDASRAAGVAEKVMLLGQREDILPVLWALDIFALFSSVEGLGWATIEAMSVGLPVVATNVTGTREAVLHGQTGLLFPYGEWTEAVEPISSLISSPSRAQALGAAGRTRAEDTFGLRQREEKVAAFFRTSFGLQ